jgi:hypothetical protein
MPYDPWTAYRGSRDRLGQTLDTKRQEAIEAPARQQTFDLNALRLGELNQKVKDQSALRELGGRLASEDASPLEAVQQSTKMKMSQGNFEGMENVTDVTNKIKGSEAESKAIGMFEAMQKGGTPGLMQYLAANGQDPSIVKSLQFDPDGLGVMRDLGEQGMVYTRLTPQGITAKHLNAPSAAAASPSVTSKVQELAVGTDEKGATMYQKFQYNPDTETYDIPLGEPAAKGTFASQVDVLTPEAVDDKAVLNLVGDKGGKVTGGRVSALANQKIENKAAEIRDELDMDRGDVVSRPQEFKALASSFLNLQKRKNMAGTFVRNMDKQFEQFKDLTEKIRYENPAILNLPWQKFQTYVDGDGKLAAYRALITDLSNEAAKLSSGAEASVAALTEGAAGKWAGIHYEAMPTSEMIKLLDETLKIGHQRLESFDDEIGSLKGSLKALVQKPSEGSKAKQAPQAALDLLTQRPELKDQFKAKYGYLPEGF